ncbi:hydrolase [Betaproteobacteria bacterium]|nr:hydrolase [Betaproteobacteria bacterium]
MHSPASLASTITAFIVKLRHFELSIPARGVWLTARLAHSPAARGLIVVLQTAMNPLIRQRENLITGVLQRAGYATFALDLLTDAEEQRDPDARYNIARLTERTLSAIEWLRFQPGTMMLPVGVLASDTASTAGIRAATRDPGHINALCLFGGRPDLAGAAPLKALRVPTCFIVGKEDPRAPILREAFDLIPAIRAWRATDGAEPEHLPASYLAANAKLAAEWLLTHLPVRPAPEDLPATEEPPPVTLAVPPPS